MESKAYVYIIKCVDGTLYTGYAVDVEQRLRAHNAGKGAKYTRGRLPVELVYVEQLGSRSEALTRESEIKKLSRSEKQALIMGNAERNSVGAIVSIARPPA